MSFLFQNLMEAKRLADERRLEDLQNANKNAKTKLIDEQIRGELIAWKKDFLYLGRIVNSDVTDKERHVKAAARECVSNITYNYSPQKCFPEFCASMRTIEQRINKKLIRISPEYAYAPVECLQLLAYSGRLDKIINYIDDLEQTFTNYD